MITLIVLRAALLVWIVWVCTKGRKGRKGRKPYDLPGSIGVGLLCCVGLSVALSFVGLAFDGEPRTATARIYSLRYFDSTSGNFFLGCGSINGRRQYVVFKKTPRGMQQQFYSRHNTYIQEGADTPHAERHYPVPKRWHRMVFPGVVDLRDKFPQRDNIYTILHVPTGTVTQEFTLE